jgi:hypothetical protein
MMLTSARALVRGCPLAPPHYRFGQHAGYKDMPAHRWGYKLFRTASERNRNYDMQTLAYLHGLAPNVTGKFAEVPPGGRRHYGFLTEAVPYTEHERWYGRKYVEDFNVRDYLEWRRSNLAIIQDLNYCLERVGISAQDNFNWDNVGMLGGRLVCIDFSLEEML